MTTAKVYEVWILDIDPTRRNSRRIRADYPYDAACRCVEDYERRIAEFVVGSGASSVTVAVAAVGEETRYYTVFGRAEPTYYAATAEAPV